VSFGADLKFDERKQNIVAGDESAFTDDGISKTVYEEIVA
jgi:hypothetical protein